MNQPYTFEEILLILEEHMMNDLSQRLRELHKETKDALELALYALEYASDLTKPEGMSGCDCPVCTAIPVLEGLTK